LLNKISKFLKKLQCTFFFWKFSTNTLW